MIGLLVAAEDELGYRLVTGLTDRLCLETDWVEKEDLDAFRAWLQHEGRPYLELKRVGTIAKQLGLRFRGKFDGASGAADALLMRKLFGVVAELGLPVQVLVVARDVDTTDRRLGFEQARSTCERVAFEIVAALAQPEAESWLVCAWQPSNDSERSAHQSVRQDLGFDPIVRSHELTSTSGSSRKDAKQVLDLLAGSAGRAEERFHLRPMAEFEQVGAANGLASFLRELRPVLRRPLGPG